MPSTVALEIKREEEFSGTEILTQLPIYPQMAADAIKPLLDSLTLDQYKHFLFTMYHYTRYSGQKLLDSIKKCDDPDVIQYFEHMYREERGHYLLAQRDYEAFGLEIDTQSIPEPVERFNEYWYSLGQKDCNEFIGGLYVFESVASLVGKEIISMIERLQLTKKQSRWLSVHLEADEGHGSQAFDMCKKYISRNPAALHKAAQDGAKYWIDVFKYALSY